MHTFTRLFTVILLLVIAPAALAQRSTPTQLLHPSGASGDQFGQAVAMDGDTMVVGAPSDDVGANVDQGSAQIYRWTGSGWTLEATLTATGGAAGDQFGTSVALSGDTAIVGAPFDDLNQGSAYVFVRSGTTWTQQARLVASDGASIDQFGISVAISGDTTLVGAKFNNDKGAAYVFTRSGTAWSQQSKLTATGGASADNFGFCVSLSADTAIVGVPFDDVGNNANQGSAFVFVRSGTTWTQQAKLTASDGAVAHQFGMSVAISGNTVIVGATQDDVGSNVNQGSAYIFVRNGTTWTQETQLTASDGGPGDNFGISVAISEDAAIVGANLDNVNALFNQGSAYVFVRSGSTWTQQAQLTAPDGATNDQFGIAVAISGDTAIVGANLDDVGVNSNQGSAWVFSRIGSRWIGPDFRALATSVAASDQFGYSVAISGDTAIVGAPFDDIGSNINQGSACVFVRSGATWTQQAQLTANGGATSDLFGISVAISGDTVVVGARLDDVGANTNQGSAYVFVRSGTTWTQQAQLTASDGAANDFFGNSVAISGDTIIVGAPGRDAGANANQGSAYVFFRNGATWNQQAQLTVSGGAAFDMFGASVGISGDTAIVGANGDDVGANADQGSAYVFVRHGATWTQQAQLIATSGAPFDNFGISVAISGDNAIVGANFHDFDTNNDQGSAYIFVRSGTVWSQQAQLSAADGAANDNFGISVAISGDTAIVSSPFGSVGANANQGSAYLFVRAGTTWAQLAKLTASDGAANDGFGNSVAISGDTAVLGVPFDDIGTNNDQGSAWFFDIPADDFQNTHNDATDTSYPTLAAAMLPARSGQQITASEAAWRGIGSINTLGRSLGLLSSGDLRTPPASVLDIGGSSFLAATPGKAVDIFGQLRVSASASVDVTADSFLLGSRGTMTARTNSSLTINAPVTELQGTTRLEQNASLTFSGTVKTIGPVTANLNSSLTATDIFTNIDTFTITAGTISTPLFFNRAAVNIFGSTAVFGSYTNNNGAVTTIRSGTLYVFGSLTNNGTIVGTICSNCSGGAPDLDVGGSLILGPDANLMFPFTLSTVHIGGSFDCAINSNTRFDLSLATLQLEGTGAEQTLEVMSTDIGPDASGLDRTIAGHYPIGTLHLGPNPSTIRLVDSDDNDGQGQGNCEALYVNQLIIDAGSRLINTSCRIYYNTLINNGAVDVPANLISLAGPSCPADFNGDGVLNADDLSDYITGYFDTPSDPRTDFNLDGVINADDLGDFITAYFNGC